MRQALQEAGLEKLLEACENTVKKLDPEARLSMALSDFTCKEWQFDEDLFPFLPLIGVWGHMHMIAFSTYPAEQIVAVKESIASKDLWTRLATPRNRQRSQATGSNCGHWEFFGGPQGLETYLCDCASTHSFYLNLGNLKVGKHFRDQWSGSIGSCARPYFPHAHIQPSLVDIPSSRVGIWH